MSADGGRRPAIQSVGDVDAAACDPGGDACALPAVTTGDIPA